MKIAVLALQGAFYEQEQILQKLGTDCMELRKKEDLTEPFDGLILPGGESTAQGKLLRELDMLRPLREKIRGGLPVLATCAGLILLAEKSANDTRSYFQTLPVTVRRNAYGRQLCSFHTVRDFGGMKDIPMTLSAPPISNPSGMMWKFWRKPRAISWASAIRTNWHCPFIPNWTRI